MSETEETFPATKAGGHALVVEFGDCDLYGTCWCGKTFGEWPASTSLDAIGQVWEKHVMTEATT